MISAACIHEIAPLMARKMTSRIVMARSRATAGKSMVDLPADHVSASGYPMSGQITCSPEGKNHCFPERTDHLLSTHGPDGPLTSGRRAPTVHDHSPRRVRRRPEKVSG